MGWGGGSSWSSERGMEGIIGCEGVVQTAAPFVRIRPLLFTYFDLLVVVRFPRRAVTWPRKDFPMARINDRQHRLAIVQFGRLLHENGFVAATDGNLSVRLDETRLLVTPTCISKGRMRTP